MISIGRRVDPMVCLLRLPGAFLLFVSLMLPAIRASAECIDEYKDYVLAQAAQVKPGVGRVFFVHGADHATGCPDATAGCQSKAYVLPGDVLILTAEKGPYSCATLTNIRGKTTSDWMPTAAVSRLAPAVPSIDSWVGDWAVGEQNIAIMRSGASSLALAGRATFGSFDPEAVRRGAINTGEFDAISRPVNRVLAFTVGDGNTLPYDEGEKSDCRIWAAALSPYLVVVDNGNCGGMGVRFSGVYVRQKTDL